MASISSVAEQALICAASRVVWGAVAVDAASPAEPDAWSLTLREPGSEAPGLPTKAAAGSRATRVRALRLLRERRGQ